MERGLVLRILKRGFCLYWDQGCWWTYHWTGHDGMHHLQADINVPVDPYHYYYCPVIGVYHKHSDRYYVSN